MNDLFQSINPSTLEVIQKYTPHSSLEIRNSIETCYKSFLKWKTFSFSKRSEAMKNMAQCLRSEKEKFAKLMAEEMGKPLREGRGEIEKCAWVCDYYAENSENFLKEEKIETEDRDNFIVYEPIGLVLGIMPWNFPFWQVFRFAAPTLMAGNGALLKHSENVTGCALEIESLFKKAGFLPDLFQTLILPKEKVREVIEDDRVQAVTLTGSERAGRAVASLAGENLKKSVLELGGSDPYILLKDSNLTEAARLCVESRLINNGQSCIAAKRFFIHENQKEEFEKLVVSQMNQLKVGDPRDEDVNLGPMARMDLRDQLHEQVKRSVQMGAKCLLGGEIPERKGAFYPPTILSGVRVGMPAFDEELFGPVASIVSYSSEDEAIVLANQSRFGLGGALFSSDVERATEIAKRRIESGACFVNDYVKSDPRLPFGGVKKSGYGRELSYLGIREFVNIKSIGVGKL